MEQYSLTLKTEGKPPFTIAVTDGNRWYMSIDRIFEHTVASGGVYSDLIYDIELTCPNIMDVNNVLFYVNGMFEQCIYAGGHIIFPSKKGGDRRIFCDCFGFTELSVTVQYAAKEVHLHSDYLPVFVKEGNASNSIRAMAEYVYNHRRDILPRGDIADISGRRFKGGQFSELEVQIILADEIAAIYENSCGYFQANSRFKTAMTYSVDYLEKLRYISPYTLQYTVRHPEQLRPVSGTVGIRRGQRVYHPEKTMTTQNVYSKDIYENRVIVGFIRTMIVSVSRLIDKMRELGGQFPVGTSDDNYEYSPNHIYSGTRELLKNAEDKLTAALEKYESLWGLYSNIMRIEKVPEAVESKPKPTAIFNSVPQYNKIFLLIHEWFSHEKYEFDSEYFMLSFTRISYLYEIYLLTKLVNHFVSDGMKLLEARRCTYPVPGGWAYMNTYCNNTFVFLDDDREITLYYQPVIFDYDNSSLNGIGLYRNNTISLGDDSDEERRGHYYVPDFLIKSANGHNTRYVICDTKYSTLKTIRTYYLPDLTYKYLFSISPTEKNETVAGLCVIYGQCEVVDAPLSVYDRQLPECRIAPFAETMPLIEGIDDENHHRTIGRILNNITRQQE